jgi:tetratricopeptide (TPR) repeat protein
MPKKHWDIPNKKNNRGLKTLLFLCVGAVLLVVVYFLPPVHDRLSWRLTQLRADIFYYFNPPEETSFSPAQQAEMQSIVNQTQTAIAPTPTVTLDPTQTPTNFISPTPTQEPSPTPSPTPLPESVRLEGVIHEFQKFNNCGPANLSMALSFWGWEGDQRTTAAWLKPRQEDRNVMPYEMVDYVNLETEFKAILRWGGDLDMLKRFIAAGFPVIIEKGFEEEVEQNAWMGHYGVLTAYDEAKQQFLIQDSYVAEDYANPYEKVERHWRSFNYAYIVVYPPDREGEVLSILGPHAEETYNIQQAARKALEETEQLDGDQLFFAWFNYGASLRMLTDYYGAAQAFDTAYTLLNEMYVVDPLYRILWYRTDPYFAYYWTGRYEDVLALTKKTLNSSFVPAIEESWVWQGRAKYNLGDTEGAIEDFQTALEWHPGWEVAETELRRLGVEP